MPSWTDTLREQLDLAAERALGEQDANPYSQTYGCFDRRFWAWKLVDFPEATFQRLALPLAMLYGDPRSRLCGRPAVLAAVRAGLAYAARVQHRNGSFDQAFPHEQSYGATAFLLYPLLDAARLVDGHLTAAERGTNEMAARRAADFLVAHDEQHGMIANHRAGGVLSLLAAAERLGDGRYRTAAQSLLAGILASQSPEGWFPEYDGADPGYQTLCVDYLSACAARIASPELNAALEKAVDFLRWFAHPDGTFGGVYGSRRTSLVYLGAFARLAGRVPAAASLLHACGAAMARRGSVGPATVDIGNLAPLLTSAVHATHEEMPAPGPELPWQQAGARADFPRAGLHVRSTARHYVVCGAANGGTVSIFDRDRHLCVLEDGGYVGALASGVLVSSQATEPGRQVRAEAGVVELQAPFFCMPSERPSPARFIVLRALNLTLMRNVAVGNWVKRRLVALLMSRGAAAPLTLTRRVVLDEDVVRIDDRIDNPSALSLRSLSSGVAFSSIHMASAGYLQPARLDVETSPVAVDTAQLARERVVRVQRTIH